MTEKTIEEIMKTNRFTSQYDFNITELISIEVALEEALEKGIRIGEQNVIAKVFDEIIHLAMETDIGLAIHPQDVMELKEKYLDSLKQKEKIA